MKVEKKKKKAQTVSIFSWNKADGPFYTFPQVKLLVVFGLCSSALLSFNQNVIVL